MTSYNNRDYVSFSNIAATPADFTLIGGRYAITINGTFGTSITLKRKSIDGSTYVTVVTAFTANGFAITDLPGGTYQLTVSSVTGIYAEIESIAVPIF